MAALGGTAILAYVLKRRFGRAAWIIPFSGLAGPALVIVAAVVFVTTDEPDGPPPGNVLLGNLMVGAILAPVTFLVSWLAVRFPRQP
jgi:peptidoglycan/LPS O-acetylase OafA/YrhL